MKRKHKKVIIEVLKEQIECNEDYIRDLLLDNKLINEDEINAWKEDNEMYKEIIKELEEEK